MMIVNLRSTKEWVISSRAGRREFLAYRKVHRLSRKGVPDEALAKGKYSIFRNEDNDIVSALMKVNEWSSLTTGNLCERSELA